MIVGPCVSEVGFELLYWIPMVRRLLSRHRVDPSRVIVVSRGGGGGWYRDLARTSVDVLDVLTQEVYGARLTAEQAAAGGQKQTRMTGLDVEILDRVRRRTGGDDPVVVHPSLMVTRFRYYWAHERKVSVVRRNTEFRRLDAADSPPLDLPDDFVALKPYFSSCFPDTDANRDFVERLVVRLAREVPVALLPTEFGWDDHDGPDLPEIPGVWRAGEGMTARNNLELQTQIVSRARALYATYGGFSYLAALLGVRGVSFYSVPNFNPRHLEVARIATNELSVPELELFDLRDTGVEELCSLAGDEAAA